MNHPYSLFFAFHFSCPIPLVFIHILMASAHIHRGLAFALHFLLMNPSIMLILRKNFGLRLLACSQRMTIQAEQFALKGQGDITLNKPVIVRIYVVAHTWPLCSVRIFVDGVSPH